MKRLACTISLIASVWLSTAHAANLMQVYGEAVQNDPVFAQAESTWHSQKMNLPIAEAGYLPQLGVTGNLMRNYTDFSPQTQGYPYSSWLYSYNLTLTQQVFNVQAWEAIKGASANVKSATATYLAAQQSLMQRTAQAYFAVLQAYDQLRYTIANKQAVWQQYVMSREQFRVGLIAVTDEYNARARYDQVVAQQISAENNLNIQLENLRVITGRGYKSLASLGKQLPLVTPIPDNISRWVAVADTQNYNIKAQSYAVIAAMDMIKQQAAAGYPSLEVAGNGGQSRLNYPIISGVQLPGTSGNVTEDSANIGLQLSYNPIQGGGVIASTEQARYNYVTASGSLEQVHRQVVAQTRSSFLSVLSFMSQVKADKESVISAKKSLVATKAGFKVGTRTMVDVLNALSTLYQMQQQYSNDRYAYVNNLIALKMAAGTLSVKDLVSINRWLGKPVVFPAQTNVGEVPSEAVIGKDAVKTGDIDHIDNAAFSVNLPQNNPSPSTDLQPVTSGVAPKTEIMPQTPASPLPTPGSSGHFVSPTPAEPAQNQSALPPPA